MDRNTEEDLAASMPPEIDIEQVVTPMTDEEADAILAELGVHYGPITDEELEEARNRVRAVIRRRRG